MEITIGGTTLTLEKGAPFTEAAGLAGEIPIDRVPLIVTSGGKSHQFDAQAKDIADNPNSVMRTLLGMGLAVDGEIPDFDVPQDALDFLNPPKKKAKADASVADPVT